MLLSSKPEANDSFHFHPGNMANIKPEPQASIVRSELTSPQQAKNLSFQKAWALPSSPCPLHREERSTFIFSLTGLQQACFPHFHTEVFQVRGMLSSSTSSSPDCSPSSATCLLSSAYFYYYNNYFYYCCCCYFFVSLLSLDLILQRQFTWINLHE